MRRAYSAGKQRTPDKPTAPLTACITPGGCGATYRVVIVSPQFEGLSLVKQHKLVKATLKEDIAEMHALTLKTYTPAKYEAERT